MQQVVAYQSLHSIAARVIGNDRVAYRNLDLGSICVAPRSPQLRVTGFAVQEVAESPGIGTLNGG